MSKLWRVIGEEATEQVLLETSAELVTVTDSGDKLEATTVEAALSELADGVKEAQRANIIDVGQGTPTTENGNTITPVNFIFSNGASKTVNIYAQQGEKGDTGATGAKIVSTYLIGHTDGGDNIYQQTFDNGSTAKFIAPKGDSGVDDYEELKSKPIIYAILNAISNPVENTYYKHVGATTDRFTNGYIYLYTGGQYKAIDGSGSGGGSANYTKIESTIPTTAWVSSAPSWIGQNALTWSVHEGTYYTQGGTEDLGLVAGSTYTATLTIDGTDYNAENSQVMDSDGMIMYVGYFNNFAAGLQIIDHCAGFDAEGNFTLGNGYYVMVILMGQTVPSSVIVKSFSAAGGISAIISNSAIKVNSAVTMYIDYNGKIKAKEKTDGSVIVTASETPITAISYAIEITDTNTEGLFEIINNNFPIIPEIPDTKVGGEWQNGIFGTTTLGIGTYQIEVRGLYGIITIEKETDATILDLPTTGMSDTSYVSDHFMIIRDATSGIMNASVIGIEYNITANEDGTTSYSIATINKSSFEGDDFRYRTLNF